MIVLGEHESPNFYRKVQTCVRTGGCEPDTLFVQYNAITQT